MDAGSSAGTRAARADDLYVDTPEALGALTARLDGTPWVALDTEFLREKTYRARLCLLQLSAPGIVACIDPLALADLAPLQQLLLNPGIVKILHAARQDLEILHQLWGSIPMPVFDTQIAAALLGPTDQIGYGRLVADLLGIELDKGHARTDWSRRPLAPAQLHYAADDVRYLGEVYAIQRDALEAHGRQAWFEDECRRLGEPSTYETDPQDAWLRLKGVYRLQGAQLGAAKALAAWREVEAVRTDRPRRWILADEPLLDIARHMPDTPETLGKIHNLPPSTLRRHGAALIEAAARARMQPREAWPILPARPQLDDAQSILAERLMEMLRRASESANIAPAMLATRREIERAATGETDLPVMRGWRAELLGDELRAFVARARNAPGAT